MLDTIDLKMVGLLQVNGRMTNVELANTVGLSAPPTLRRLHRLEHEGIIVGYHADVHQEALGWSVEAYAGVSVDNHAEFQAWVASEPRVRSCHLMAGAVDYVLRIVARDWIEYEAWVQRELMPRIKEIRSGVVLETVKEVAGVPVDANS